MVVSGVSFIDSGQLCLGQHLFVTFPVVLID